VLLSTFMELHGETVWASIAAVFITAVIGWVFYWLTVRPKRFSWEIMSLNPLISAPDSANLSLKVLAGDRKMDSPNIMVVRLGNTGRKTIHDKDFDGPINLEFKTDGLISSPLSVKRAFSYGMTVTSKSFEIFPRLIKSREYIDLQFITDGPLEPPQISLRFDGKVAGITKSEKIDKRADVFTAIFAGTLLVLLMVVLGAYLPQDLPLWQGLLMAGPVILTGLLALWARTARAINEVRWR
jgi:hypothetical protein